MFRVARTPNRQFVLIDGSEDQSPVVAGPFNSTSEAVEYLRSTIMKDLAQESRRLNQQLLEVRLSFESCNREYTRLRLALQTDKLFDPENNELYLGPTPFATYT